MRRMTSPFAAASLILLAAPFAGAQVSLSTINTSFPSGGEPEAIVLSGTRVFVYNPVARSFSIFDVTPGSEAHRGTRFIQDSPTFPDLTNPELVANGNHVYLTNTGAAKIWAFDLAPSADATTNVSPLASLTLPSGANIFHMAVDSAGARILAADNTNGNILVIDDGATPAFDAASPITGGGLSGPNFISVFASGTTQKAYVSNNNNSVTVFGLNPLGSSPVPTQIAITGGSSVGPVASAPLNGHVAVYVQSPASLAIIDASTDTYDQPSFAGRTIDLAPFIDLYAPIDKKMILDDRALGDSRLLILMNNSSFHAVVVHVDLSHNAGNPTPNDPSVLGFTSLSASNVNDTFEGDLMVMDPFNKRLFVRSGEDSVDIIPTDTFSSPRINGGPGVSIPLSTTFFFGDDTKFMTAGNVSGTGRYFVAYQETGGIRVVDTNGGGLAANLASSGFLTGLGVDPLNDRLYVSQSGAEGPAWFDGMTGARTAVGITPNFTVGPVVDPTTGAVGYGRFIERTPGTPDLGLFFVKPDGTVVSSSFTLAEANDQQGVAVDTGAHRVYLGFFPNTIKVYDFNPASSGFGTLLNSYTVTVGAGNDIDELAVNPATGVLYISDSPTSSSGNTFLQGVVGSTGAAQFAPVSLGVTIDLKQIVVHPGLNRIYYATTASYPGFIDVRDGSTGGLIGSASLPVCSAEEIGAMAPLLTTNRLYIQGKNSGNVSVMNMDTSSFTATLITNVPGVKGDFDEDGPTIVASARNLRVYFVDQNGGLLKIVDADPASTGFNTVVGSLTTGLGPQAVAVNEKTGRVFVINEAGDINVFGPGIATVTLGPINHMPAGVLRNRSGVPVFPFRYVLNSTEDAQIQYAQFHGSGTGNEATGLGAVNVTEDTDADGFGDTNIGGLSFSADNGIASTTAALNLTAGSTRAFVVQYDINGTPATGATFQVTHGSQDVKVVGASSGIPLTLTGTADPIVGGVLTIVDPRTSFSLSLPGGTTESAYRMIGVPLDTGLTTGHQAVEGVTGGSTYDKTQVRVIGWDPLTQTYVEFDSPEFASLGDFGPFDGFWFIQRTARTITWSGTSTATTLSNPFSDSLSPGWNLIHVPFDASIPLSSITVNDIPLTSPSNTNATQGGYCWNGSSYSLETGSSQPGVAYWIQNLTSGTLTILIPRSLFATKAGGGTSAGPSRASAPPPGAALPPPPPSQAPTTSSSGGGHGGGGGCFLTDAGSAAAPLLPYALAGFAAAVAAALRRKKE